MAYGRRKGQRAKLMDLAKKSRARAKAKRADKSSKKAKALTDATRLIAGNAPKKKVTPKKPVSKAARARTEINTPKGTTLRPIRAVKPPLRKMKGGTNLSARAGQVDPTARTPKQPTRTPAQRATAKKKLLGEQKTLRKASSRMRHGSEYKAPGISKKQQDSMTGAMSYGVGGGAAKAIASKVASKVPPNAVPKLKGMLKDLFKKKATTTNVGGRATGLGGGKPPVKPKTPRTPKKKKSAAQIKRESMRGSSQWSTY